MHLININDVLVFLMRMWSTRLEIHTGPPVINKLNRFFGLLRCGLQLVNIVLCKTKYFLIDIDDVKNRQFPELYLLYHVYSQSFRGTFWMSSSTLHRDCHLTSMSYIQLLKVMQGLMWDYISLELTLDMLRFSMKKICQMKALHNFFCWREVNWTKLTCIHF